MEDVVAIVREVHLSEAELIAEQEIWSKKVDALAVEEKVIRRWIALRWEEAVAEEAVTIQDPDQAAEAVDTEETTEETVVADVAIQEASHHQDHHPEVEVIKIIKITHHNTQYERPLVSN